MEAQQDLRRERHAADPEVDEDDGERRRGEPKRRRGPRHHRHRHRPDDESGRHDRARADEEVRIPEHVRDESGEIRRGRDERGVHSRDSTCGHRRFARLLARSGTLRREQIGLISRDRADEVRDELAGRRGERHSVPGEARVHVDAAR